MNPTPDQIRDVLSAARAVVDEQRVRAAKAPSSLPDTRSERLIRELGDRFDVIERPLPSRFVLHDLEAGMLDGEGDRCSMPSSVARIVESYRKNYGFGARYQVTRSGTGMETKYQVDPIEDGMTPVKREARTLVGYLVPLVEVLHRKCEGNSKVAIEIGDALNETTNAMMNLGKALDEAGVPKPNVGVELEHRTTRDGENLIFKTGLRMRPLTDGDEAKLAGVNIDAMIDQSRLAEGKPPIAMTSTPIPDAFDKRFADADVAGAVRKRAHAIGNRLRSAVADNSPGDHNEDRRVDILIDELAFLFAEIGWSR